MLEAGDIILISIGCLLLFITLVAILLASIAFKRRVQEEEKMAAEVHNKITRQLYWDHPYHSNTAIPKHTINPSYPTVVNELNPTDLTKVSKDSPDITTEKIPTLSPAREPSATGVDSGVNISKAFQRASRPYELSFPPSNLVAEKAQAINTRHSISSFRDVLDDFRFTVLRDEFEILESRQLVPQKSSNIAAHFQEKNRFGDIVPFDDNRVVLRGVNDYINASYIDGYRNPCQFIATQGPMSDNELGRRKVSTLNDFWSMIWQTRCCCIVMLTDCVENMQTKCSRYWPAELGRSETHGMFRVSLMAESHDPICDQRELDVVVDDEARQVTQFHFRDWRDSEAASPSRLLDFIERIMSKHFNNPIVVHCSAGVGRTGVFIATWRLLERARRERSIDVFSEISSMRSQRSRMVQSIEQYHNVYETVATAIMEQRI